MTYIKPIPVNLLIHTVSYEENSGVSDGWDDSYNVPIDIQFVRVEPIKSYNRSSNSEGKTAQHTVFIDRVNSSPYLDFKVNSRITFKGKSYEVTEVKPLYDLDDIPHHYELGLT